MAKRGKGVRIVIVVEDESLERFSRDALLQLGFSRNELRVTPYHAGRGSAKDWVDKQYPIEVRAMRSKAYQKGLRLVIGTDADEGTVTRRANRLAATLEKAGLPPRDRNERIVLWIPKWNVETWILYFAGDVRDEDNNYKNEVKKPDYWATAKAFVAQYRDYRRNDTIHTQPSLKSAYHETKRLDA